MHPHRTNPPVSVSACVPAPPRGRPIPGTPKANRPDAAAAGAVALLQGRRLLAAPAWAASPVLAFILELHTQAAAGEAVAIQPLASLQK
jgi:hypothetical protein